MICETMSREKYMLLKRSLKLVGYDTVSVEEKVSNKFWKMQPLIETLVLKNPKSSKVLIDEQLVSFWGSCFSRQTVRGKPNPCVLKVFVVTSSDGLPLDFFPYQ